MSDILIQAVFNFALLLSVAVALGGSAIACMWITEKLFRNPFVGLSLWAVVAAAIWAVHEAAPA